MSYRTITSLGITRIYLGISNVLFRFWNMRDPPYIQKQCSLIAMLGGHSFPPTRVTLKRCMFEPTV